MLELKGLFYSTSAEGELLSFMPAVSKRCRGVVKRKGCWTRWMSGYTSSVVNQIKILRHRQDDGDYEGEEWANFAKAK